MKRLIALAGILAILTAVLTGCNGNDDDMSMLPDSSMSQDMSQDMSDNMSDNNGAVNDGDGIIGNEGDENNNGADTSDSMNTTDNSDESSAEAGAR